MSNIYPFRCASLILIAAGYGWAGGHYIPAGSSPWAYVFQFVILLLLLVFGVGFLTAMGGATASGASASAGVAASPARLRWNTRALSIFAGLTLLINIGNIVQGAMGKSAFGSHNSFADLVPIGMIIIGDVIWLSTILKYKRGRPITGQSLGGS